MSTLSGASYEPYDTIRKDNATSNGLAAAPPRAEYYLQHVPLTPQQQQQQPLLLEHGNGVFQPNARKEFCRLDMRYIRSLEGVVRYLSLVSTLSYCTVERVRLLCLHLMCLRQRFTGEFMKLISPPTSHCHSLDSSWPGST